MLFRKIPLVKRQAMRRLVQQAKLATEIEVLCLITGLSKTNVESVRDYFLYEEPLTTALAVPTNYEDYIYSDARGEAGDFQSSMLGRNARKDAAELPWTQENFLQALFVLVDCKNCYVSSQEFKSTDNPLVRAAQQQQLEVTHTENLDVRKLAFNYSDALATTHKATKHLAKRQGANQIRDNKRGLGDITGYPEMPANHVDNTQPSAQAVSEESLYVLERLKKSTRPDAEQLVQAWLVLMQNLHNYDEHKQSKHPRLTRSVTKLQIALGLPRAECRDLYRELEKLIPDLVWE